MQLTGLGGKVALVTGAAQGIGEGVARALATEGALLVLADRNADGLAKVAAGLVEGGTAALAVPTDLTDEEQILALVERCVEAYGRIDMLVNVAGVFRGSPVLELSSADYDLVFAVNTRAVFLCTQAVARQMAQQRSGAVVTIASNAALLPRVQQSAYCASKAAVAHLTKCFALELAPYGIRCNNVLPGAADTPMVQQLRATLRPGDVDEVVEGSLDKFRPGIPLGRLASVEQIANAVLYLLSDQAAHITMHDLVVDGGGALGV
jgi:2,3-dihydro-2,3-dihydroxybenzoate dehydrogenase